MWYKPEGIRHADHLLLILRVLNVCVGEVDDGALDGVTFVAVNEYVWPPYHLPPQHHIIIQNIIRQKTYK